MFQILGMEVWIWTEYTNKEGCSFQLNVPEKYSNCKTMDQILKYNQYTFFYDRSVILLKKIKSTSWNVYFLI